MFDGHFLLGSQASGVVIVRSPSNAPVDADNLPTYRTYGPNGLMVGQNGTLQALDTGVISDASNNTPIIIESEGHNRNTGDRIAISGVLGNTGANGTWSVTKIDSNHFELDNSTGSGEYESGGIWHAAGVYSYHLDVSVGNGFVKGSTYQLEISCLVGGFPFSETHTFIVS